MIGAGPSQTRASLPAIVTTEGGGFSPTLELGGGAGALRTTGDRRLGS
jgi:hypothetical protein